MRTKLISVCLGLLTLLLAIVTFGQAAQAATISTTGLDGSEAIVTDRYGTVITDPTDLSKWQSYKVSYDWSIPNGQKIQAGDTAPVTLPGNVVASSDLSFDLKDDNGATIGTFTIKAGERTGTITFTEQLIGTQDRQGTLNLYAKGTADNGTHGQDWALNKIGWVSEKDENGLPTQLTWNIAFNPSGNDLGTVTITDTIGPNQTYVPGSIHADTGMYNEKGEFISAGQPIQPEVTVNGKQLTFVFEDVHTAVNMTYNVKLSNVSANGGSWMNDATMNGVMVGGHVTWGGNGTGNGGNGNEENPGISGAFQLQKTDAQTGAALAGAEYQLQDQAGKVIQTGLTTDANGKLYVSDLAAGQYVLIETKAPAGYDINKEPISFVIKEGTDTPTTELTQTDEPTVIPPKTGSFTLTKLDAESKKKLAGAVYELRDATGKVVQSGLTTDADGELTVKDLVVGNYTLVETKAPAGYDLNPESISVVITDGTDMPTLNLTQTDEPTVIPPKTGSFTLTKLDAESKEKLAGAVYELRDAAGKVVQSGLTTDAAGELTVKDLVVGDYTLVETKAPVGFELSTTPIKVTIVADQSTPLSLTATDDRTPVVTKGSVQLTKTDSESGQTLAGAIYELQDAEGKVLKTDLTTDEAGKLTVTDLAAGDYRFVETKAPADYELNATAIPFTVKVGQTELLTVTAKDAKVPVTPGEPENPENPEGPENPGAPKPPIEGPGEPGEPGTPPKPPIDPDDSEKPEEPNEPGLPNTNDSNNAGSSLPQTGGNSTAVPNPTTPITDNNPGGTIAGTPIGSTGKPNQGLPQTSEQSADETLAAVAGVSVLMTIFAIGGWDWRRKRF